MPRSLALFALGSLVSVAACDTNAVGIDECRSIEVARCQAARSCDTGLEAKPAETECELFARDNCLHGLAVAEVPASSAVNACVAEIQNAGKCATKNGKGALASDCGLKGSVRAQASACDVVENPDYASECAFLNPSAATPAPVTDAGAD